MWLYSLWCLMCLQHLVYFKVAYHLPCMQPNSTSAMSPNQTAALIRFRVLGQSCRMSFNQDSLGLPHWDGGYAGRQVCQPWAMVELSCGLYKSPLIRLCRRRCEADPALDRQFLYFLPLRHFHDTETNNNARLIQISISKSNLRPISKRKTPGAVPEQLTLCEKPHLNRTRLTNTKHFIACCTG